MNSPANRPTGDMAESPVDDLAGSQTDGLTGSPTDDPVNSPVDGPTNLKMSSPMNSQASTPATSSASSVRQLVFTALFTALIIAGGLISIPLPGLIPIALADFFVMLAGIFEGPRRAAASVALYLTLGCIGLPVFAGGKAGLAVLIGPTGGFLVGYLLMAVVIGVIVGAGKSAACISSGSAAKQAPNFASASTTSFAVASTPNANAAATPNNAAATHNNAAASTNPPTPSTTAPSAHNATTPSTVSAKCAPSVVRLTLALVAGNIVLYVCGIAGMMLLLNLPLEAAILTGLVPFLPGAAIKIVAAVAAGRLLLPKYGAFFGSSSKKASR